MGSARDGSPDPTRASNSACLLESIRLSLPLGSTVVLPGRRTIRTSFAASRAAGGDGYLSAVPPACPSRDADRSSAQAGDIRTIHGLLEHKEKMK